MGVRPLPAEPLEPVAERVAALLVLEPLFLNLLERTGERGDGGLLDGQEHTEVNLAAQLDEGGHHVRATHAEADARTRDVEALGEREKLNAHLERAGIAEERAAARTVEDDVRVSVVVHDDEVVGAGEVDDLLVELGRAHGAHRVGGQAHDHVLGAVGNLGGNIRHVGQEVVLGAERVIVDVRPGELGPRLEDGVARIGHDDGIAGVGEREREVADALLRAVAAGDHVGRDARDAEAALVVVADRLLELGQVAQAVLPHGGVLRGLGEGVHHVRVRREVRRAHGQVVDGAALGLEGDAAVVQRREDLRAKQVEPMGELHGGAPFFSFEYTNPLIIYLTYEDYNL